MRAEILSIGTELLLGQIVDTNAAFIAERLAEVGLALYYKDTVGDNMERLVATLRLAMSRAEVIICTGGLGPTADDITAEGIAIAFDAPLQMHETAKHDIEELFRSRGRPCTDRQFKQAMMPRDAVMVLNPVGTAPGFILTKDGKTVIALPGPPQEMQPMWRQTVGHYLRGLSGEIIFSRTLRFCGIGESVLEAHLEDLMAGNNPTVAPYAKLAEVHLRLTARAGTIAEAEQCIAPVEAEIRRREGRHLYGIDEETLEVVVGRLLRDAGMTLAVAESCTGGLLGGRMTSVPGSSDYFLGGVISYNNAIKQSALGVSAETLARHGAVSEETAREMAAGALRVSGAKMAVSITGIAGPDGGTPDKPVGLVYIGLARTGRHARALRYSFWGDRQTVRARAVQEALVLLREELLAPEASQ